MKIRIAIYAILFAWTIWGGVVFQNDSDYAWGIDHATLYEGQPTLRTAVIGDSESTSVTLTFEECDCVNLWVKSSSEAGFDKLVIEFDDGNSFEYSGEEEWQQCYVNLPWFGAHDVTLTYIKDGSVSQGEDGCWIWFNGIEDLKTEADDDGGSWGMDVEHPWELVSWMSQGNNAGKEIPYMQSPSLSEGETSWISHAVEGVASFTFYYAISSEEGSDYLRVTIDGEEVTSFSGESWYCWYEIELPDTGRHVIRWTYEKDSNGSSSGNDRAFIWYDGIEEIETAGYSMNLVYPWVKDTDTVSGGWWGHTPLRSGEIPDGTMTSFSITVKEDIWLNFFWKCSSEEGHDKLKCLKNGELVCEISGEVDWTYECVVADAGDVVTWQYEKDDNGNSSGQDCGWVDYYQIEEFQDIMDLFPDDETMEVTETKTISLDLNTGRAVQQGILNASDGMAFTSGVERLCWHMDESQGCDGPSLRSGNVSNGESSYMQTTVVGAGTVTFNWKVSSEENGGVLSYYVDEELRGAISGETGWSEVSVELVEDARHEIRWEYAKSGGTAGADCGWVDGLTWHAPLGYDDPDEPIVPASVSTFMALDLTPSPTVTYKHLFTDPKAITFSPDWSKAASVVLKVNGQTIQSATDSGTYDWKPSASGTYVFTLEQLDAEGKAVADPLFHTFEIKQLKGVIIGIY